MASRQCIKGGGNRSGAGVARKVAVGGSGACRVAASDRGRVVQVMSEHLADYPALGEELIFRGPLGAPLRRNNFHRSVGWSELVVEASLPAGFHFHDLRHTGNNLAAASGASTRELMHWMGHGSMRAALMYQRATNEHDHEIAGGPACPDRARSGAHTWPEEY
jgi:hypothetical protein